MPFRDDPCGIFCIIIAYAAIFYADYVVVEWIILPSMSVSFWGMFHATAFNFVLFLLVYSHFRAVTSDPGIVPLPSRSLDFSDVRAGQFPKRILDKEGGHWTVCQRCEAYRPPRAHHCRVCRRCIRKMDHHCPWINNCVGEFNQKYFIQFLFYVGVASIYAIALIVIGWIGDCHICQDMRQKNARIAHTIVLVVLSLLFGLFVCAIGCDQITAIFDDETAVEQVQNRGNTKDKPEKTTMELLREVFGRGPIYCWLVPCRTTRHPLLTPPGFDV